MENQTEKGESLFADIWQSFLDMKGWVKIWVALILMPVNITSLFFLDEPMGIWVACLAMLAMIGNMPVMIMERGFTRTMALPHLLPWTLLVGLILFARPDATGHYDTYLTVLLAVNIISLLFDYRDAYLWLKERKAKAAT